MWKKPHATSSFSLKDGTKDKWKVITTHKGDDGHEWTLVHPRYQVQKYHGKMPISPFRIVLSRNDFTLATSKDLAPLLTECWMYLTDKIPTLMPETVQEKDEESVLWIVSHINELHLAAGQHHSGKKGHTADSPSLKVSNDAKVFKELEESVDYSELGSDVELESVSSSDLAARDSLESFRLGEISTSRQFLTASTTAVEGDSKKTSLKFWKKDSDSALNTSASIVVDEKKAQKDVKDGEEETDESLYISVVLFFQALFHEDATREQRTQKYCIMLAVFTTVYSFIARYCSFDLFLVLVMMLNAGLSYIVIQRKKIITALAKRKLKKVVNQKKRHWFPWLKDSASGEKKEAKDKD